MTGGYSLRSLDAVRREAQALAYARLRFDQARQRGVWSREMESVLSVCLEYLKQGLAGRARHTLVAAAVATALGVFSVPAMSADQADLQGLQDQINKLQREMDRMKALRS